jgi:hypothetical protein
LKALVEILSPLLAAPPLLACCRPGAPAPRNRCPQLPAAGRHGQPAAGPRDIDTPVEPASLTKLMTAYLVFDALRAKKIDLKQTCR